MSFSKYEKHLVECPHCHKDVLDHMTECPFCKGELTPAGYAERPLTERQKTVFKYVRIAFWIAAVVLIAVLLIKKNT